MNSYTTWERDAYIERVGGPEEAERRHKALMARQSGLRFAEERKRGLTQAQVPEAMGVPQAGSPRSSAANCLPSRTSPATSRHSAGALTSSRTSPTTA